MSIFLGLFNGYFGCWLLGFWGGQSFVHLREGH